MQLRNSPPLSQGDVRSARGSQGRVVSIKGSVVCSPLCLSFYFLPAWVPKAASSCLVLYPFRQLSF